MWDVALSTMWAAGRFEHLQDFLAASQQLGFAGCELNYEVDSSMLAAAQVNGYRIISVHEPCPADISVGTLRAHNWLVSASDEECRQQGMHAIRRSIDLARELSAPAVILHLGRVDVDPSLESELRALYKEGQAGSPLYEELKERLVMTRAERAEISLSAVRRSLLELAEYAGRASVRLGIENRYHYLDIPLLHEMEDLFALVDAGRVGFWYDTGHAQTLENLGFGGHEEWLQHFAQRMVGAHLHDIRGLQDHFAAGLGEIDWDMVARYLPPVAIKTFEVRAVNTPEQVAAALQFLTQKGCLRLADPMQSLLSDSRSPSEPCLSC